MNRSKKYRLEDPTNVTRIFYGLIVICVLFVAADFLFDKHVHFVWEKLAGFHGLFGFVGCVFLVLAAKQLRKILMRGEDYYD